MARAPRLAARSIAAALLALGAAGCAAPVGVTRPGIDRVYNDLRANVLNRGVPGGASRVVLDRYDLWTEWRRRPAAALDRLLDRAAESDRRDALFALAELHLLVALEERDPDHALASAAFAGEYLFAPGPGSPPDPWDSTFADARDIGARALLEAFRAEPGSPGVRFAPGARDLPRGSLEVSVDASALPLDGGPLPPLYAAEEYAVRGLRVRHRRGGVGLPLVVIPPPVADGEMVRGHLYRGRPAFAATAVLRLEGGVVALAAGRARASVALLPPADVETVEAGGRRVPVAADFTAPFALGLQGSRVWAFELGGILSREPEFRPGLILTAPHHPGRIPIVLVHGTASSPARWAELVNTLYGEKWVRDRFEFWLFLYATGNPVPYSANLLRTSLAEAVQAFDPEGRDPAIRRMVLVGHSQGGLLCRMNASSSGEFTATVSGGRTIEDLALPPDMRDLLRDCLEFGPSPTVARVVYLCTPHRGSFLAGGWLGSFSNLFVRVGQQVADLAARPFRTRSGEIAFPDGLPVRTSVENMMPGSPFLAAIAQMPPAPGVPFHTIAAVEGEGDPGPLDDGVVAYASARLEGAASEFVVRWDHSCQSHPLVIEEVRRILLEHAGGTAGR